MSDAKESPACSAAGPKKRRLSAVNEQHKEYSNSSLKRSRGEHFDDARGKFGDSFQIKIFDIELEPPKLARRPLNDLQVPPVHHRPSMQILIFGNGDMGQFGLGTSVTGDIPKPRLHSWFETAVKNDTLGSEVGAGIEFVSAGGMHTLAVDELGKVRTFPTGDFCD